VKVENNEVLAEMERATAECDNEAAEYIYQGMARLLMHMRTWFAIVEQRKEVRNG
jgi:hypothetical protein